MSRTIHSKGGHHGDAWWGKRPLAWHPISHKAGTDKWYKRLLHKMERVEGKAQVDEELDMEKAALSYFKELREAVPPEELEFYGANARMGGITGIKPKHKYTGKERE